MFATNTLFVRYSLMISVILSCLVGIGGFTPNLNTVRTYEIAPKDIVFLDVEKLHAPKRRGVNERIWTFDQQNKPMTSNHRQFDYHFALEALPQENSESFSTSQWVIYMPSIGGKAEIFINGLQVGTSQNSSLRVFGSGTDHVYITASQKFFHPGQNRIGVLLQHNANKAGIKQIYFGPEQVLDPVFQAHENWQKRQNTIVLFWCTLIVLGALFALWIGESYKIVALLILLSWLYCLQIYLYSDSVSERFLWLQNHFSLVFLWLKIFIIYGLFIWHKKRVFDQNFIGTAYYVFAIFTVVLGFIVAFQNSSIIDLRQVSLINIGVIPLVVYVLIKSIYSQTLRRSNITENLRQVVEQKEAQLQTQIRRSAVLEERQRLTRDMHDGIGGQLLSLLVRVRGKRLSLSEIEHEIQNGINDLRLIVDAMDDQAEGIMSRLAVFRTRAKAQLEAANIDLRWTQSEALYFENTPVRSVLNIYRFLQETISNIIRHSNADTVQIRIEQISPQDPLVFHIKDNGVGMTDRQSKPNGKGLRNMKTRAVQLGGRLQFTEGIDGEGFGVTLILPASDHINI